MLLSLSGFLFEDNYDSQSVSFAEFCSIAQSAGYNGVELRRTQVNLDTPPAQRAELLRIAGDAGLTITCLTARAMPGTGNERDDFFHRYLELCRDLECRLLKIGSDTHWLRQAATTALQYGVTLATNNHINGPLETVDGTRTYFAQIDHDNFALLYDSLHLYAAGQDYLGCIDEFIDRTSNILVHSVRPARTGDRVLVTHADRQWAAALPDEPGTQDWPAILKKFRSLGYDGLITVFEHSWPTDQRTRVANHCAETIRRFWTAAGNDS